MMYKKNLHPPPDQLTLKFPPAILSSLILGLLTFLYAPLLWYWYDGWLHKNISIEHEYFSQGIIGLPYAVQLCWFNRGQWQKLPDRPHPLGVLLLLLGGIAYQSGQADLVNLSFPTILTGLCLWLKSIPGLQIQGFSLLLVWLATPNQIPYLITPYFLPLQTSIAHATALILNPFGLNIKVDQIYLYIGENLIEANPHASSLKMVFTSLYLALMLLYWRQRKLPPTQTTILFLTMTIILSIIANIIRNIFLIFFYAMNDELAFDWLNQGWGGELYSALILSTLVPILMRIEKLEKVDDR